MSDTGTTTVTRTEREGLFELTAVLVGGLTRVGLSIAAIPLILLPKNSRRRARRAMAEFALAAVALPKELTAVSERVVDDLFAGTPSTPSLPSPQQLTDRARAFTERLARAADEFGASVGRAAGRAADQVERTAAKVDEWVERPPQTPSA